MSSLNTSKTANIPNIFANPLHRWTPAGRREQAVRTQAQRELGEQMLLHPEAFTRPGATPTAPGTSRSPGAPPTPGAPRTPSEISRSSSSSSSSSSSQSTSSAPSRTRSGATQWDPSTFVPEARGLKGQAQRLQRRTGKVARKGRGVSRNRYLQGLATAGAVGLAAGFLIVGALHLAVAALAAGCLGLMGVLGYLAFKRQSA